MARKTGWTQADLDASNIAMAMLDQAGNIVLINQPCCALVNATRRGLSGKNWFDLFLPEGKREAAAQTFLRVMAGEEALISLFEQPLVTVTAARHSISWKHVFLRNRDGGINRVLCVGTDVTEQKRNEEMLRFEGEEQAALNTILRVSMEDFPLVRKFEHVLDLILALSWLPIEPKGGVFQVEGDAEVLTLKAQRGLNPALLKLCAHVPFGHCLCGRAAASREIEYAACLDPRHEISYPGIAPHGHYNVPILSRDGVLGVMVLYLKHGHARNDREVEFLESVANTLAGMIEHRRIRDALMENQVRLAETQRIAHLGGWSWNIASDAFLLSDETCRILEMPPQSGKLQRKDVLGLVHPDERDNVERALASAIGHDSEFSTDFRILLPNGQARVVNGHAEATRDIGGKVIGLSGTLQDITQRKSREEKLRQAAVVFENTTEGVMITDAAGRIIAVNRSFSEITGYAEDQVVGQTGAFLKSGRHDEQFYASMWSAIRENGRWQGEIWNRRKNGDVFPEWLNISMVKDERGQIAQYVGVFSDISAMKESESRLDHLAHHDPLTSLPNRLLLNARMEHALARAHRGNTLLAVLFLDLDHFKNINDTLGHPIGDLLLQEVAQRLVQCVREEDTVARLGGDEFTILLEELDDSRFASSVAQKIIAVLAERFMLQGHEVFVTCSVGISIYPGDGGDITSLFKNADSALYRAKEQGRNNYQYYTEELTIRAMERLAMENDLRHALQRNELVLHYQPQVDLYNGCIIGMEALLRWQHPEIGLISPNAFIPLAEETGLIIPIGEWVLRTACARLKAWMDEGLPKIRMGVNLSSRQFNQNNLDEVVAAVLHDTGLPPDCLELELTERIIMQDAESTITILQKLRALGVQFSIDDFGTGYSSLSYLKRFPIDRIKIDQSFVREIISSAEDAAVSQAIISLAHSLNLKTVAEGVETAEQQEFLRTLQCDEIQGFHFSRPVPEQEISRLLRDGIKLESRHEFIQEERVLLLVDDEENILNAIARVLHEEGYRILCADRPRAALDLLATHAVGVIISDQRMPEMNGIELLRKVRKLHPDTVRIMLTAHADQQVVAAAINEGAVFKFIFKPWTDEQLRTHVREAFRKHDLNLRTRIGRGQ
ncbi:MAG: EAL domain-containing protein [Pseudomonadota bacterium]|nr:EAL domain-containing protein [Pseudomonadota bacterium]MDP1903744.1 EAL domain-containing protein [Pseudomonadota bacterium]MDP2351716.1 EAL domain-containing protein [Pseudomonadota bacterium]